MPCYTGIGSRQTPAAVLDTMRRAATLLGHAVWTLRSGGAAGADGAFQAGATLIGGKQEIYLPWPGFNAVESPYTSPTEQALALAGGIHPAWSRCRRAVRLLHARNVHQVLGPDCTEPSLAMVCWTPGGRIAGGTATAIRLAHQRCVPVLNLGASEHQGMRGIQVADWVNRRLRRH
ncbi:hypothetical protein RM531_08085 [Salinisphaera sp. P385]|uniref:DNA recombination-mediator protein A n=1 Tax=Spectribacter acetivorans TaxID=3075603 RepID=A0ABU3BAZ5_9GAMM|nr:hypothetical protein [Salinisphaera sp. P385]MDT0618433.1 hypothetical protein [Salinisphaera sp. P385]